MKNKGWVEELKHQGTDVRISAVFKSALGFVVVFALIHVGIWLFYRYFRSEDMQRDVRRTFVESKPPVPPEPRLQVSPEADLQNYLQQQRQALTSYGWISRPEGRVRIPIDRAMELVVERNKR
jgi:hypothetical protein